jgi:DNA-binding XRE family transcriptional regulator
MTGQNQTRNLNSLTHELNIDSKKLRYKLKRNMIQPELGNRIAEIRKQNNLTQEELVERCNVSLKTIQRIEAGEVTPRDSAVRTILDTLEQDIEEVMQKLKTRPTNDN